MIGPGDRGSAWAGRSGGRRTPERPWRRKNGLNERPRDRVDGRISECFTDVGLFCLQLDVVRDVLQLASPTATERCTARPARLGRRPGIHHPQQVGDCSTPSISPSNRKLDGRSWGDVREPKSAGQPEPNVCGVVVQRLAGGLRGHDRVPRRWIESIMSFLPRA